MTDKEALGILTRFNAWRRDNETEFPELPDSPVLIGEAIDTAIQGLRDLEEAIAMLNGIAKIRYRTPASPEEAEESNNIMLKVYKFLAELE